jgi:hypothetical protein
MGVNPVTTMRRMTATSTAGRTAIRATSTTSREATAVRGCHSRRRVARSSRVLQMSVLLEAEQLCIQVAGRDGVEPSNHGSEHQIILFIKAGKKLCDQLIITKRRS